AYRTAVICPPMPRGRAARKPEPPDGAPSSRTRRSTLSQSRTLCVGMDVHQETMAVAYVAQDPGAEVPDVGPSGTRQSASETLIRTMPSTAQPRISLYD